MDTLSIECPDCTSAGHAPQDCLVALLAGPAADAAPHPAPLTLAERRALDLFGALGMLAPDASPEVVVRQRPNRPGRLPRAQ